MVRAMPAPILPPPDGAPWPSLAPEAAGFDPAALADALAFAAAHETPWPLDLAGHIGRGFFEPPPDNEILGPVAPRGPTNGLVLRHGHRVAAWGDTRQVDHTFSVAKSYLSLLAGIAVADGLIGSIEERVGERVRDGGFDSAQNAPVTWRHLLTNTSEWEGELFGKSDRIDRGRDLVREGSGPKGVARPLKAPGTHWEYNDVRVNRLALSLLRLFRRPLPEVFRERVLGPIGGSSDWRWEGYRTSWVEVDGRRMQSVPGGTHWGGGVSIHAEDQARIGLLVANRGRWGGARLVPEAWLAESAKPCPLNPNYGFLWWLAPRFPSAAPDAVFAAGAGGNLTWIEPSSGIVAVLRWVDPAAQDQVIRRIRGALKG